MSRLELEKLIKESPDEIPELEDSQTLRHILRNNSRYFRFPFVSNNETFIFSIVNHLVDNPDFNIRFIVYKWDSVNKKLIQTTQFIYNPLGSSNAPITLRESGEYYLEILPNQRTWILSFVVIAQGFKNRKILQPEGFVGRNFDGGLQTFPRRNEQHCDLPLRYQLLEGELPPNLKVNEAGYITGIICSIDDMIQAPANNPSFNWFFQNHGGVNEPIGLVFRFKMKVWILGTDKDDPDFYDERWFCLRIFNNWSFDKIKLLKELGKAEIEIPCPTNVIPDTPKLENNLCSPCIVEKPQDDFQEIAFNSFCMPCDPNPVPVFQPLPLKRDIPRLELCMACQDPTKDRIVEKIILVDKQWHTPEEIFRFYTANLNNTELNSTDMARLSNSTLFKELVDYLTAESEEVDNPVSLIEMNIKNNIVTLTKFEDITPLDNPATIMRNIGNLKKTALETEAMVYWGNSIEVTYEYI